MTIVPPTIAGSARRSEAPVAIMRIRAPKPAAPAIDKPLIERPAQAAAITTPRIVTPTKRSPPRYVPAGSTERTSDGSTCRRSTI